MRLYAFHCGGEGLPMSILDPMADDPGLQVEIPYFFYLIQHDRGNVLFDTGSHPSLATDPVGRLGPAAELIDIRMSTDDGVVDQLARIGAAVEDVSCVVQSHLHYDHAGGLEFFADTPVIVQEKELPFARRPPIYQQDMYSAADLEHTRRWQEIDGEHDLFGDGRVVAFPTPGHTPGHQSLLVKLDDQAVILVADAAYMPESLSESRLPGILWSPDAMVASWQVLRDLQREHSATLLFTHDRGYESNTRVAPEAWYE